MTFNSRWITGQINENGRSPLVKQRRNSGAYAMGLRLFYFRLSSNPQLKWNSLTICNPAGDTRGRFHWLPKPVKYVWAWISNYVHIEISLAEQKCIGVRIFAVRWSALNVTLVVCICTGRSALECGCNYLNEEEVRWECAHLHMWSALECVGSAMGVRSLTYLECAGSAFISIPEVRWSALQCTGSAFISIPGVRWVAFICIWGVH